METTQNLSLENKEFYDKTLLKRLLPSLLFANYGQKKALAKNSGKTISFRKFNALQSAETPLTEGVTPAGNNLSMSEIKATVNQYGDYVEISDVLDLVGIDPVLTETAELLGEQAGITIDNIVRDIICSGTNVRYVARSGYTATSTDTVSGVMTSKEIQKAVRTLKNDNAKPFDGKYYIGIIDPDISYDLQQDPLFLDVSKYNGGTQIIDGEIGKLGKVRFIETTNTKTKTQTGGGTVHCAMIIGKDAYGIVDIEGMSKPEMIVKPHGSSGTADPLNQRATSGWKALFTAKRLDELSMIRIECLTSTEIENEDIDSIKVETSAVTYNSESISKSGTAVLNGNYITLSGEIAVASETPFEDATNMSVIKITSDFFDLSKATITVDGDYIANITEDNESNVMIACGFKSGQTLSGSVMITLEDNTTLTYIINGENITLAV